MNKSGIDNRANQLNPNNSAYASSRLEVASTEDAPDVACSLGSVRTSSIGKRQRFTLDLIGENGQIGLFEFSTEEDALEPGDCWQIANEAFRSKVDWYQAAWKTKIVYGIAYDEAGNTARLESFDIAGPELKQRLEEAKDGAKRKYLGTYYKERELPAMTITRF